MSTERAAKRITITIEDDSLTHLQDCLAQMALDNDGTAITVSDVVRRALRQMAERSSIAHGRTKRRAEH